VADAFQPEIAILQEFPLVEAAGLKIALYFSIYLPEPNLLKPKQSVIFSRLKHVVHFGILNIIP